MSLKRIDSDDPTAFSSMSSSNIETNTAIDGVDFLNDEAGYTQQMSSHQGLNNSIYNSLFKADSRPDGNVSNNLMTSTKQSIWADLVGKASCSSQSSPTPTRAKGPRTSSSDSNHSGMINWVSMVSNQNATVSNHNSMVSNQNSTVSDHNSAVSNHNSMVSNQNSMVSNHNSTVSNHNSMVSNHNSMMSSQNSPASTVGEDTGTPEVSQRSPFIAGMSSRTRKQHSPSYNHEPYNRSSCSKKQVKSHTMGFQDAPSYADVGDEYSPFSISADCFNAAINEDSVPKNSPKTDGNHISKVKQLKFRSLSSNMYNKDHKPSAPNRNNQPAGSRMFTTISSQGICKKSSNGTITKTTFSTVTTPCIPNAAQVSPMSPKAVSLGSSDQQVVNPDLRKHRYNQTALALQQSGLMKTTIKTAELLRKSKVLQQELLKLRKEAGIFMHSVLNNPENKHLKELYLPKKECPPSNS